MEINLSKRLKAICDLVPDNSKVIDVGSDHALASIYLEKNKNCEVLATDISSNCIKKAKENISKYSSSVKTKVTDGLNDIYLADEVIIISGMGTKTILNILSKDITNDLIISSNNHIPELKKRLYKKGYRIYKEVCVHEKRYYVITYYKYKQGKVTNPYISPFLKDDKDYLKYLLDIYKLRKRYESSIFSKLKYTYLVNKINRLLNN